MNMHKNARLTPRGRERIVRQVESGQTPEAVAEGSGGPILPIGTKAKGHCRDSATSNRHRPSITSGRTKPKLSGCLSTSSIHWAERKTTPSGTTPCRTSCHFKKLLFGILLLLILGGRPPIGRLLQHNQG